jgi:unsaturated rhamnogalacturonyl hydrolase
MKFLIITVYLVFKLNDWTYGASTFSERMADTVMTIWKNGSITAKWSYEQGVVLNGLEMIWLKTGNDKYLKYIQKSIDLFVDKNGTIHTYKMNDYNIDNIKPGGVLLTLFNVTKDEKYYNAAHTLRQQLKTHPRTHEGGFWHKKKYPYQMWLDGIYMAEPFYIKWALTFNETEAFDDIANQFIWMESHVRDTETGLLYHGWDESRNAVWSKTTGHSPNFWARAMGWYGMALVDVLQWFPKFHEKRQNIVDILKRYAVAVMKVQDNKTGLWWDVLNFPNRTGNYLESSASCMFVYTFAKGVRSGYLPSDPYLSAAKKGYEGITKYFIENDVKNGILVLNNTVRVSSLDQDGTYDYYMKQKVVKNDPKGVGAFILTSSEIELLSHY